MTIKDLRISGGKVNFKLLTLGFQKENPRDYEIRKIVTWLDMLNKGQKPKHWNKPNKNGTAVTFDTLSSQKEYDIALSELEGYTNNVNSEYGTDLSFKK